MNISLSTQAVIRRISDLLNQMTLDEKLAQLDCYWMYGLQTKAKLDRKK